MSLKGKTLFINRRIAAASGWRSTLKAASDGANIGHRRQDGGAAPPSWRATIHTAAAEIERPAAARWRCTSTCARKSAVKAALMRPRRRFGGSISWSTRPAPSSSRRWRRPTCGATTDAGDQRARHLHGVEIPPCRNSPPNRTGCHSQHEFSDAVGATDNQENVERLCVGIWC